MIVAIAGNAVEHVTGIVLAARGQSELAISVVKNSVAQIAAFLYPLLVLVSLLTATTLTFSLAPVYIGALIGTAMTHLAGHGGWGGHAVRGRGADRHLRDPGDAGGVRVLGVPGSPGRDRGGVPGRRAVLGLSVRAWRGVGVACGRGAQLWRLTVA